MKRKGILSSILSVALALCMVVCMTPSIAFASGGGSGDTVNYVSIGASNTNGYGLRGYIKAKPDDDINQIMEQAALDQTIKAGANVLGYLNCPEGSYPDLVKKAFVADGKTVKLDQLAISSMRAEEVRILLDDNYLGDKYSAWRFVGTGKWFDIADGTADGNFDLIKGKYRQSIENADVITLDIGVNNFGVYLSYMLTSNYSLDNDISVIDENLGEEYLKYKQVAKKILAVYKPELNLDNYDKLVDTFAYALVGFCYNFDKVVEKIYELNPDVTLDVVSIQNLMTGLKMTVDEKTIPVGDLVGSVINAANSYMAVGSPYADKYLCTDVRQNGRVQFFIEDLLAYDENPTKLSPEMIDCFNVLDGSPGEKYSNGLHMKYMLYKYLVTLYGINAEPFDANPLRAGEMLEAAAPDYGVDLQALLNNVYDTYAKLLKTFAECDTMDISMLDGTKEAENALLAGIQGELEETVKAYLNKQQYTFPEDFYGNVAAESRVSRALLESVGCMGVRVDIGNSFFGHPDKEGHQTVAKAILASLENNTKGVDLFAEAVSDDPATQELVKEVLANMDEIEALIDKAENISAEDILALINETKAMLDKIDRAKADIEKLKPLYEELQADADEALVLINDEIKRISDDIEQNASSEALREYAAQVKTLEDLITYVPTDQQSKDLAMYALVEVEKQIEKAAAKRSQDLADQIAEISAELNDAITTGDYEKIKERLMPIAKELIVLADAVQGLPELQDAIAAYMQQTDALLAKQDAEITALKAQVAKLTAKSIDVDLEAEPVVSGNSAWVEVKWTTDEDADGYILKVNGVEVTPDDEGTFVDNQIEIGQEYTYQVIPYVLNNGEAVYGKTYSEIVFPQADIDKVTLKKALRAKKAFKVKFKEVKDADGYVITYKKGKNGSEEEIAVPSNELKFKKHIATYKVTELQKKTVYYVNVCAYKMINDKPAYGPESKTKKVKTK